MLKGNSLPIGAFFMVLIIALASLAVGYALWSKVLLISGTVNTGDVDAVFLVAFTDDDDKVDNPVKDYYDLDNCPDYGNVDSNSNQQTSCDPKEAGAEDDTNTDHRYDKDVARCDAEIDSQDPQILHVSITNGYPSYWCNLWFDVQNTGSIPVKVQAYNITGIPSVLDVWQSGLEVGDQIEPQGQEQGDLHIHVLQEAKEGQDYHFSATITLVQWNEFDAKDGVEILCQKDSGFWACIPGATGVLYYDTSASTFNYDFDAEGLAADTDYSLIYYPEPQTTWPWPITVIDAGTSDSTGDLQLVGTQELNQDLSNAKIWLVKTDDIVGGQMSGWNPDQYLLEETLVNYDDTDV